MYAQSITAKRDKKIFLIFKAIGLIIIGLIIYVSVMNNVSANKLKNEYTSLGLAEFDVAGFKLSPYKDRYKEPVNDTPTPWGNSTGVPYPPTIGASFIYTDGLDEALKKLLQTRGYSSFEQHPLNTGYTYDPSDKTTHNDLRSFVATRGKMRFSLFVQDIVYYNNGKTPQDGIESYIEAYISIEYH